MTFCEHTLFSLCAQSLSPGRVNTPQAKGWREDPNYGQFHQQGQGEDGGAGGGLMLEAMDIADAVLFVLGSPPHVLISELTIVPRGC